MRLSGLVGRVRYLPTLLLLLPLRPAQQLVEEKQRRMCELKAEVQTLLEQQRQLLSADIIDTEHWSEAEWAKEQELAALRGQLQLQQGHSEMLFDDVAKLRRQLLVAEGQARARAARAEGLNQLLVTAEAVQEQATQTEQALSQELRASRTEVEVLRGQWTGSRRCWGRLRSWWLLRRVTWPWPCSR